MARLSRVIAPGLPHIIAKEGNRQQQTFEGDEDYLAYLKLLAKYSDRYLVGVLGYCLLADQVKLLVVPQTSKGLVRCMAEVNRRYALRVNARQGCRGHLWRGRFASFVLQKKYLPQALRYVERFSVRAGWAETPQCWPWSSASAHVAGRCDGISDSQWVWDFEKRSSTSWVTYISEEDSRIVEKFETHEKTGRPVGNEEFLHELSAALGRNLVPGKPGRPRKKPQADIE